jgi:hypothetical protein
MHEEDTSRTQYITTLYYKCSLHAARNYELELICINSNEVHRIYLFRFSTMICSKPGDKTHLPDLAARKDALKKKTLVLTNLIQTHSHRTRRDQLFLCRSYSILLKHEMKALLEFLLLLTQCPLYTEKPATYSLQCFFLTAGCNMWIPKSLKWILHLMYHPSQKYTLQ